MPDTDPAKFFESEQSYRGYKVLLTTDGNEAELALMTTITYHNNIDSDPQEVEQVVRQGVEMTLKSNAFTRPGYRFKEWNLNSAGTLDSYADGATFKPTGGSIHFFAQ